MVSGGRRRCIMGIEMKEFVSGESKKDKSIGLSEDKWGDGESVKIDGKGRVVRELSLKEKLGKLVKGLERNEYNGEFNDGE